MPSYTFDVSRYSNLEQLVHFDARCESEALKEAIWYHDSGLYSDGYNHAKLMMRRAELEAMSVLSAQHARRDLNDVGFYHV